MKYAFGEFHLWYQVALSMVACGKVRPRAVGAGVTPSMGSEKSLVPPRGFSELDVGEICVDWDLTRYCYDCL